MNFQEDNGGYVLAYRRAWAHPVFANLLEAAIWNWLYQTAVWKKTQVRFNGQVFTLERGQLVTSMSFIANGFGITQKRANGLFKKLQKHEMLVIRGGKHGSIITICNYDVFQPFETTQVKQGGEHRANAGQTQGNNKNEDKQYNEVINKDITSCEKKPKPQKNEHEAFNEFWQNYPTQRRINRVKAAKQYGAAIAAGHAPLEILAGVLRYAASEEVARGYAKNPTGWLKEERFLLDYKPQTKDLKNENRPYFTAADAIRAGAMSAV